jgi:protein involved in polysaccharide export with SLBB domain
MQQTGTEEFRLAQFSLSGKVSSVLTVCSSAREVRWGVGVFAAAIAVAVVGGCNSDSYMNPSVIGRWENTPTVVPILERLDVIEQDEGDFVDITPATPEDLIPEPFDYTMGNGDYMRIVIADFFIPGVPEPFERNIDEKGFVSLPQLGRVYIEGLTQVEGEIAISQAIAQANVMNDALVTIELLGRRSATFGVYGALEGIGRYPIPTPDYRIRDALTDVGGLPSIVDKVYVIRDVPLAETYEEGMGGGIPTDTTPDIEKPRSIEEQGEDILDLLEELTAPEDEAPAVIGMSALEDSSSRGRRGRRASAAVLQDGDDRAAIDLPDSDPTIETVERVVSPLENGAGEPSDRAWRWMFLEGRWVQVSPKNWGATDELPEDDDPLAGSIRVEELVTQRVIEIPTDALFRGVPQYNIVIRPGDHIHVPAPDSGFVYIGGPGIARPGVYNLPQTGRLTLTRSVMGAGGLSQIAIPERVDLTRMVGDDRQATIRLNLRAIYEGTQPDIVLKRDDMVNFGTNFWATPLAVLRGGLRTSYGFGFLLDRNFGNDVFGAPPTNRNGN